MADSILTIKDLSKTYSNGVQALKNVSFEVKKGEFLVVIGLSGSGKSTLLRCVNHLVEPTSGQIIFEGADISHVKGDEVKKVRTKIAMIFQHFNLIPRHSVLSNVLMGRLGKISNWKSIFGLFSDEDKTNALKYLNLVGISEKARIRADQLSGGQQQRVAIARALAQQPSVLLADEPVASLDPATCHVVMDYLKKVNQEFGITIVCNLHFLSLVRQYATRVIALKDGQLVFEGRPDQITDEWFQKIYGEGAKEVGVR
jgi:phosphonate transport system ATP-binding protein